MIVRVASHRKAATRYEFSNGNEVSIIFGPGSYTENMDKIWESKTWMSDPMESKTVEIMAFGHPDFESWFADRYEGENPAGHIPVSDIPMILKRADSKIYEEVK